MVAPRHTCCLFISLLLLASGCPVVDAPSLASEPTADSGPRASVSPLREVRASENVPDALASYAELSGCKPLLDLLDAPGQNSAELRVDRHGTAYLAYDVRGQDASGIDLATDASGAWKVEPVTSSPNAWVDDLQVDATGGVHVLYTDLTTSRVIHVARRPGGTWASSVVGTGHGAALAVDAEGTVHVAYRTSEPGGARYARSATSGTWRSEPVDALTSPSELALALDGAGRVHVAYVGSRSTQLFHAVRSGLGGWTRTLVATRGGADTLQRVDLAVGPGGEPAILFVTRADTLYLAERQDGAWSAGPVLTGVDSLRKVSLAIDAGGNHHVGYMRGDYSAAYATDRTGPWRHVPLLASSFAPASMALTPSSQPVLGVLSPAKGVVGLARPCPSALPRPRAAVPVEPVAAPSFQGRAAPLDGQW